MGRMDGKVCLITGAASGIGLAAAIVFLREGAKVVISDLREEALKKACEGLESPNASYAACDVTDAEQIQKLVRFTVERYGGIDVLLGNAGIVNFTPVADMSLKQWETMISINLTGNFLALKYTIPELRKRGGGSVILTSSIAALRGFAGASHYCAAKAGLTGLARAAALEEAPNKIRVNTVHPGFTSTPMMEYVDGVVSPTDPKTGHTVVASTIPMKRYAQSSEIAELILFLGSSDSSYITGETFVIDGGAISAFQLSRS